MARPLVALALASLATGLRAQIPPPLPPPPAEKDAAGEKLPQPGALPEGASKDALEAWKRICDASLAPGAERRPVSAFELALQVRYRGSAGQSNDFEATYRFFAPGFVRIDVEDNGHAKRAVMRGPDGDFLIDFTRGGEKVPLGVGREYAEDRKQLDETVAVARNFVALTDPRSLRILALEKLAAAPAGLPEKLSKRAAELTWLRLRTPDFGLVAAGAKASVFQATLGADPKSGWVEIALVDEDGPVAGLRPSSRLVELVKPRPLDGFFVPQQILVWTPLEGSLPPAFPPAAGTDLWVGGANLRAPLKPEDFRP